MRTQTARCCCGDFTITVSGEPNYVHTCHCDYCQRRTGSVFQVSALYGEDQIVSRSGHFQVFKAYPNSAETFSRANVEAPPLEVEYRFCKRCGSTVYWEMQFPPGVYGPTESCVTGVAVGCFFDPNFPKPVEDTFVRDRHHWIRPFEGMKSCEGMPAAMSLVTGEPLRPDPPR